MHPRETVELFLLGIEDGIRVAEALGRYIGWYNSGRLKRFADGYDTLDGRRARLGLTA